MNAQIQYCFADNEVQKTGMMQRRECNEWRITEVDQDSEGGAKNACLTLKSYLIDLVCPGRSWDCCWVSPVGVLVDVAVEERRLIAYRSADLKFGGECCIVN